MSLFCHSTAVDGTFARKSEYGQQRNFNNKILLTEESITNRDVYGKVCVLGKFSHEGSWYCGTLTMEYIEAYYFYGLFSSLQCSMY